MTKTINRQPSILRSIVNSLGAPSKIIMNCITQILKRKPSILVVGDIMLDHYIYGKVDRISPEAPVPVVRCMNESDTLGGCGNVIRNLTNIGVRTSVVTAVGNDLTGRLIIQKLKEIDVSLKGIFKSEKIQSTHKMRVVAENQQIVRVDWDSDSLTDDEYDKLEKLIKDKINNVDGVLISDYGKSLGKPELMRFLIKNAIKTDIPIFVDPKGKNWAKYSGATMITPNTKEVERVLGQTLISNKNFENAGRNICNNYNIDACLITRGKDGMTYYNKDQIFHVSSRALDVYDVSGAGDTVIACLTAAKVIGLSDKEAVEFANNAAGIVVGHVGTSAITKEELL